MDGAVPCVPGMFDIDLATARLMFVLDRSGSMAFSLSGQNPPPPGQLSRWELLRSALAQTIVPFDNQLAMGAKFFPEVLASDALGDPAEACRSDTGVGIAPARGAAQSILDVFDTTQPNGGTPTSEALRLAAEYLSGVRTVARTMVLATDGAPNCNGELDAQNCICTTTRNDCDRTSDGQYSCLDDSRTVATIGNIFQTQKIPVYVIGIGSTERPEFLQVLDEMAVAGGRPRAGTPKHYNVQTAGELTDALATIRDSIAKCTYLTPSAPTDPNAITIDIDGMTIPRDPTHMNGWDWVDQTYGEIAFFGAACTAAGNGSAHVTGNVSCATH
ncbi:MAG TPA: vWA domain-containing protein [Labilithrix sp.]